VKAAILYETHEPLRIVETQVADPGPGEVRVRVGVAGVCLSDHHFIEGTGSMPKPVILGHEGAGTIESLGPGVTGLSEGDRCIFSFVSHCGFCRACQEGSPQLCETNRKTGARQFDGTLRVRDGEGEEVYQMSKLGLFAEQSVIPKQAAYPITNDVPMEVAALIGCCVTTGVGAVINNPMMRAGATVAVFGCGGVGLNVLQGARLVSASRVIAVDLADDKLEFSRRFGATDVVNASKVDPVEAIKELTGGGVDFAFDAFGGATTISQCVDSLRSNGVAVMIGLAPEGERSPIEMVSLVRNQKHLMGSYYGSASPHETFGKMLDFYRRGLIDVSGLITRRYPLDQINEGFEALISGGVGRGVLTIDPNAR
jgi:S-(hydroxymethyl)glutathione dehydrogenase / alcohol dehydrogenase